MVVAARFLLLCAALLALPGIAAAQPTSLAVQRVWTQDAGGNDKTTFAPGEAIRLATQLNNSYGGYLLGANGTQLTLTTSFYNDAKPVDIPPGVSTWTWDATAPSEQNNYTVTAQAYDHFLGVWTTSSASFVVGTGQRPLPPQITNVETFQEGDLVFFRLSYTDPDGDAEGFGFRGIIWAEESHPFSDPSFGRVSPGTIEYPFNHLCQTGPAYESDVEAWIYDRAGLRSQPVTVHLKCAEPPPPQAVYISREPQGKAPNLIVLVHGCCTDRNGLGEWDILGKAIFDKIRNSQNPEPWEIVVWPWTEDTPVLTIWDISNFRGKADYAYRKAFAQGARLKKAIVKPRRDYNYIHLIGHSAGANLIDVAAKQLKLQYMNLSEEKRPFLHLTFLDAYTPSDADEYAYGFLSGYPKHYSEHFVDKSLAATDTDTDLRFAFNFDITAWPLDNADQKGLFGHQWPRYWYEKSVRSVGFRYGYPLSLEGSSDPYEVLGRFPAGGLCSLAKQEDECMAPSDWLQYIASYGDLIQAFGLDEAAGRQHYEQAGRAEGRVPDTFNERRYIAKYPDLRASFGSNTRAATVHYITNGYYEGRTD
jgi:hypothetical protein